MPSRQTHRSKDEDQSSERDRQPPVVASYALPDSLRSGGLRSEQVFLQSYSSKCSRWADRLARSEANRSRTASQVTSITHSNSRDGPLPQAHGGSQQPSGYGPTFTSSAQLSANGYAAVSRGVASHTVPIASNTSLPSTYGCHECPVCSSLSSIMSASMMAPASLNIDDQDTSETPDGGAAVLAVPEQLRKSQARVLDKLGMLVGPIPPQSKEGSLAPAGPQSSFGSVDDGNASAQIPSAAAQGPHAAFDDEKKVRPEQQAQPGTDHSDVVLLEVSGMTCGACVGNVKRILEGDGAVKSASVNLTTGTALVHVWVPSNSEGKSNQELLERIGEDLAKMVSECGFDTVLRPADAPINDTTAKELEKRTQRLKKLRWATYTLILAWVLTAVALAGHLLHQWKGLKDGPAPLRWISSAPFQAAMSIFILLGPARGILVDGVKAVYHLRPDMNVLVGLGAISGLVVSFVAYGIKSLGWTPFFAEPAMLLSVVLLGRSLEERAKLQASSDMAALYKLLPVTARRVVEGSEDPEEVRAEKVGVGDVIVVLPGDRVPVDGVVVAGRSDVNEAAVTGEPMPVTKSPGSAVTAGTSNVDGVIKVRSEAAGGNTTIAGIVKSVEEAQARTAPVQKMADAVAGRFAMVVILISLLTIAFWALAGPWVFPEAVDKASRVAFNRTSHGGGHGGDHDEPMHEMEAPPGSNGRRISMKWVLLAVQLGCSVLVVACPCALGLATPTAVLVGSSVAAKRGLLVRGGDILESMTRITHVVFDKTGTLTQGKPSVAAVTFLGAGRTGGGHRWSEHGTAGAGSENDMLALAAAVEEASTHPLAKAVVAERKNRQLPARLLEDGSLLQEPGSGISGVVEGHEVAVGNEGWMQEVTRAPLPASSLSALVSGATRIFVAVDGEFCGHLDLVDQLRPTVAATLNALHDAGLRTLMLTGDTAATAISVGAKCGLRPEDIFAGVKPDGKLQKIQSLQASGAKVAMVGDGINDTSALAASDVGIAMSGGVQAAGDVAKVVLLRDCPSQVADAFRIARVTLNKIRQNLVWAFGYNVVAIPIAAGILLPPLEIMLSPFISAALMAGSSLAVMGNSLLLRRETNRKNPVNESAAAEVPKGVAVEMPEQRSSRWKQRNVPRALQAYESPPGSSTGRGSSDLKAEGGPQARGSSAAVVSYHLGPQAQDAPRAAAPMRQGFWNSTVVPGAGSYRQLDIRPGDIRTMLVGQDHVGPPRPRAVARSASSRLDDHDKVGIY